MTVQPFSSYRSVVGSLLYLALCTRPDIAFAVHQLSKYVSNPGKPHWHAATYLLRYLCWTVHLGLRFYSRQSMRACHPTSLLDQLSPSFGLQLLCYSDADWARCPDDRHSVSGVLVYANGCLIMWRTTKQKSVALSTAEAEYMAFAEAVKVCQSLRKLLTELHFVQQGATTVREDNQACLSLTKNDGDHGRTKHIDIRYHYIREAVENGVVVGEYCRTDSMLADLLTKPLPRPLFVKLRDSLVSDTSVTGCASATLAVPTASV